MQNDKLLNCPFCNRRAELRHDKDGFSYIVCANDGCYVRTDGHLNEESAIRHWNSRKSMERIVEQLEEKAQDYRDRRMHHKEIGNLDKAVAFGHKEDAVRKSIVIVKGGVDNAG